MIDQSLEYEKMAAVEQQLWWYRCLHHLTHIALQHNKISHNSRILDAGCGTGGLMDYLIKKGYPNISGIDLSADAIAFCKDKQLNVVHDDVRNTAAHIEANSLDVIVSNDVLCYFKGEAQQKQLAVFSRLLKKNGLLIMNLPSLNAFSGMHDISVGINHRFHRNELKDLNYNLPLELISNRYWPFFLSPLIYLMRSLQRLKLKNKEAEIKSDVYLPNTLLNSSLWELSRFEINHLSTAPFGSSLFVVYKKNTE
jgi:SAM-dependent methyltransferase